MKMIVGLGNPSQEFKTTYHNVGMLAVEDMAKGLSFKAHKKLFKYAVASDAVFILPLTFMNKSGAAVKEALKKFGGVPEDLAIVHDESDITIGTYKMSQGRNAAGHNGVQSIIDALRSKEFLRLRIGIREKDEKKRKKASEFVLARIKPKDLKILRGVFKKISEELFRSL